MSELSPRERRQKRTRQAILDTALTLVAEKGADNLSLREIARQIDYSPAGLYEYFGSKDEIVETLCTIGNQKLTNYLRQYPTHLPFQERMIELGMAYIRFAREHPELFTLIFTRMQASLTEVPKTAEHLDPDDSFIIVLNEIEAAVKDGLIQTRENFGVPEITYSVWACVHGMAALQTHYLTRVNFDFEATDRESIRVFLNGLMQKTD